MKTDNAILLHAITDHDSVAMPYLAPMDRSRF